MKTLVLISVSAIMFLFSKGNDGVLTATDYADCVTKYRSGWGESCSQCVKWNDSYVVYLKNSCSEKIDVMVCVQEEDKSWRRFQHTAVAPGDSIRAYACAGSGKYLNWARKTGDEFTVFPGIDEVNQRYKD